MSLLFRVLMRIPAIRRLEEERNTLRAERDSMRLKVRAASAEMGVLEEQGRVLVGERHRCAEQVEVQTAEHERLSEQLTAALEVCDAATAERDRLKADRDALIVQRENAISERDQFARNLDQLRQGAATGPSSALSPPHPATEEANRQGR